MIRFRSNAQADSLSRNEFRAIFYRNLRKLAFERELESIESMETATWQTCVVPQEPPPSAEFSEPQYESSLEWLEARERLKNAAATETAATQSSALSSTLIPAARIEWADELEDETVGVWTRSNQHGHAPGFRKAPPRAPRTLNSES